MLAVSSPAVSAQPVLGAAAPSRGPVGASVAITGNGLSSASAVRFGGTAAPTFTVESDERITAVVPSGAKTGPIAVDTDDGTVKSTEPFAVQPNVVVIMTDDQRWDTLSYMPIVSEELANQGVTFTNAFVSNPLCCPSRVTFLTGQYSHTSGVWNNDAPYGGFEAFTGDATTVATRLSDAGYRTALVGKYLNQYWLTNGQYVPPGWDVWESYATEVSYYDYVLSFDGAVFESHGSAPEDYATDVLAADAGSFIRQTSAQKPLLLWFTPPAPHEPSYAAPRHVGTFEAIAPWRPPTFDERDVSDKPPYVASKPRLGTAGVEAMDQRRQTQLESLLAVDDAVGGILDALADTGRLGDTLLLFTSDNGFMWGEHRLGAKTVPYEESIRVPFVIRWDRLSGVPRTSDEMVVNVDVAPTITAAAGAASLPDDGRSLLRLLEDTPTRWRTEFVLEHQGRAVPSYCGIRGASKVFVHYADGTEEYYRLGADPYQKSNAVSKIRFTDAIARLRDRARARCQPRPPEMPPF